MVNTLIKLGWSTVPTYFVEEFDLGNFHSPRRDSDDQQLFICLQHENPWHLPPAGLQTKPKWNTGSLWSKTIYFSPELSRVLMLSPFTGQKFTCVPLAHLHSEFGGSWKVSPYREVKSTLYLLDELPHVETRPWRQDVTRH